MKKGTLPAKVTIVAEALLPTTQTTHQAPRNQRHGDPPEYQSREPRCQFLRDIPQWRRR